MKILSICSARPNFVKLAAVHHALKDHADIEHKIIHTGQHYDPLLSDVFFTQLEIPQPNENLGIHGGTREEVIERTKDACVPVFKKQKPDWILVYGDVNGAVGAAKAAKELGLRLAHVEAGLRSGDVSMPEEHNRIAIDRIADLLLCSEQSGVGHLKKEKVTGKIQLAGNTMIDTLMTMMPIVEQKSLPFTAAGSNFAIATLHRPSNVDDLAHLERTLHFLGGVARIIHVVLPFHPRTHRMIQESGKIVIPGDVFVIESMGYIDFMRQMKDAKFILTDSGGIQEEATFLGKRCFTLRKNTERPSTIESGSNTLIDLGKSNDRKLVLDYAKNPTPPKVVVPKLWDGKAGERIVKALREF